MTHDLAQKKRALLFTNTLILFHLGVLVGYFAVEYLGAHGIWVAFVPLVTAVGLVIPVGEEQVVKDVEELAPLAPLHNPADRKSVV